MPITITETTNMLSSKLSVENLVKAEDDINAAMFQPVAAVVSPADPLVALAAKILTIKSEVGVADLVVGQLAKSTGQPTVND